MLFAVTYMPIRRTLRSQVYRSRSTVTRHSLLPLIPTLGFAAGSGRSVATVGHLQFHDPRAGDFLGGFSTQLHTFRGCENPFPIDGIEQHVDVLAVVSCAHAMVA